MPDEPEPTRELDAGVDTPAGMKHARRKAEKIGRDPHRVRKLLAEAATKATQSREKLGEAWKDLQTLFRLLKAWVTGQYKAVPWRVIVLALTAVVYFVNPFDLIPDFLGFGLLDDIGVIAFLIGKMGEDLERFREWEGAVPADGEE